MTRLTPIFCLMVITLLFAGSAQAQIRTEGGLAMGVGVPQRES